MTERTRKTLVIDPVAEGIVNRIAPGTVQTGDLHCKGGLFVEGTIRGNLIVDGMLVLGGTGVICGNVTVRGARAALVGTIAPQEDGSPSEIRIEGVAELGDTLVAAANIAAQAFNWYHGAKVDGQLKTIAQEHQTPAVEAAA